MKPVILLVSLSCFLCFGCSPKNEEVTEEQIDTSPTEEVVDTVTNMRKDAVKTDENNVSPTFPLPQPIMQLLTDQYPSWQEPAYTENVMSRADDITQGPGIIRGDFNGDNMQDYAIQLQQQKQVLIVAILNGSNGNWQLQEIKKDILFNDRGEFKSPYLLRLTKEGTDLQHQANRNKITSPHDAVTISLDGNDITYLYENGKFVAYNTVD